MNLNVQHIGRVFIFMAGLIILAHAVVPHHHHDNIICIENTHCADDTSPHNHNYDNDHKDTGDHDHDCSHDVQTCFLNQFIPNQNNENQKILKYGNSNTIFPVLVFAIFNSETENFSLRKTDFSFIPIKLLNYTTFVTKCFGLRAPPVV
jgi:hypothetical protein